MKCMVAIDRNGNPVWDAYEQDMWSDQYRLCGGDVPDGLGERQCPRCGETYWCSIDAGPTGEDAKNVGEE